MKLLARCLVMTATMIVACGLGEKDADTGSGGYDDGAERAALVEDRGFSFVGFVPITVLGIDGLATIQPRAFTVHEGTPAAVIEVTRLLQQGRVTSAMAGAFTNGWVEGPGVSIAEPSLASDAHYEDLRWGYWFDGSTAMSLLNAKITAPSGPSHHVSTRRAGVDPRVIEIEPWGVTPVDAQPDTGAIAYAYRDDDVVAAVRPPIGNLPPRRYETKAAGPGRSIALATLGDEVRVATTEAEGGHVFLAVYRRSAEALERIARVEVEPEVDGARMRVLHTKATYVAAATASGLRVYRVEAETLTRVPLPAGDAHTVAIDDEGALYVGFSDPASEGRASVQKIAAGGPVAVGEPGFSRDAVTAHVFPRGPDVYVAFTSTTKVAGAAIACAGPSCVPYRKKEEVTAADARERTLSCSYEGDMCRQAKGTSADGLLEFEQWCATQAAPTYRVGSCPPEGAVGACRKTYDGVEELSWSYGTYGKTAGMVQAVCKALGLEFVPAP